MGFSRQEYWSGLSFPSPGDLPDLGIEPESPALQAESVPTEPPGKPHSGEKEATFIGRIDVRLVYQLPGKPMAGAGASM